MSDQTKTTLPAIPVVHDGEPVMSFAQERLWFMDAYAPGTTAYTIPEAWRLHGPLDPAALAGALDRVVARHEPLRTRFPPTVDGRPVMAIDDVGAIPLVTAEAESDAAVGALVDAFMAERFDLITGPVARAILITIATDEHVFALAVHHIAADGWSTEILLGEVLACLAGSSLPELPLRYRDFAAWQRVRHDTDDDVAYWREHLAGVAPLELPTDRQRPPVPAYAGAAHRFSMAPSVLDKLFQLGRRHRSTPYMVLLTAFAILLGRRARQDDVTIGSPTAGRSVPELDNLIGCFINMVTMRIDTSGDPTFVELLQRVRASSVHAFAHQELPFERLVTELNVPREVSRSPLFQVVFSMQSYETALPSHPSLTVTADVSMTYCATRFDLELHLDGDRGFLMVYNTALFTADTIADMSSHFRVLLEGIAADPLSPISSYELLRADERTQRIRWNDTSADLGADVCLHNPVEAQARRTPDDLAVIHPQGQLSHAEVDRRADHLAAQLTAAGVTRGDLVAVVMERGWEQVVAVLAINKAGAAYLPVDADLPERRRNELIARGGCTMALTQEVMCSRLTWPDGLTTLPITEMSGSAAPACPAQPDDLAYVIFTSGSTGTPKGVMIEHRAALNTVRDITARFRVGPRDRVFALSALSFDLSVYDIYGTLAAGATLVMGRPAEDKDPAAWARTVKDQRITIWNSVPALMELLVEHAEQGGIDLSSLRLVMMSGDWIPPTLPDRIRAIAPNAEIISLGGATEGSIWSIFHPIGHVDPSSSSIPYGRPLTNQQFHILDRGMCDVPVGVPGELYIGGSGVATGYWKDPERTAAAFVTHPRTGAHLYRTGDLGRYRSDGLIEFLGRSDAQVKIRGYRIELGEIGAHLTRHPSVAECVVTTQGTGSLAQLVAYVVAEPGHTPNSTRLRSHLASALPAYMVPSAFVTLPQLPLTANGKVDRRQLPAPAAPVGGEAGRIPPRTDSERAIHAVWADALDRTDVGIDDDFFDVGGHSLLAIRVVEQLRRSAAGGTAIAVMDLFTHPTIRRLAALLDGGTTMTHGLLHRLTPEPSGPPELSYVAVPYGGGGAMVYKPLADALPATHALWSVAIPGHDIGIDERRAQFEDVAARCVQEIQESVTGPIALYGHCVGSALAIEIARRLEAIGRVPEAVYLGAHFPSARPGRGLFAALGRLADLNGLRSDRAYADELTALGLDMSDLDPAQARHIVRNTRRDAQAAEDYFTELFENPVERLQAPVISVAGEHDPASDYYQERFREWHVLSDTTAVVLLDEAGHFFQKHHAAELAEIVTTTHSAVPNGAPTGGNRWRLLDVSRADSTYAPDGPPPAVRRFLAVATGQLASITGSALTAFAIPIWIYLTTSSIVQFALFTVFAVVPGLLITPMAGTVVDRCNRRTVMLAGDVGAGAVQLLLGLLLWTGNLQIWQLYLLLALLSVALVFQRLAYNSAVAQLVPKRYLGHAIGIARMATGTSQLVVPIAAVGLLVVVGLEGILVLDVVSYTLAIAITLLVRFPRNMAGRPESTAAEIGAGFRYMWSRTDLRWMLLFFATLNVFLTPLVLLIPPLVLSVGTVTDIGWVLLGWGLGGVLGGLVVTVSGGPPRRRMRDALLCTVGLAAFCLLTGLRANLLTIGIGAFGMSLWLTVVNGAYAAIVSVKVPQRFHDRVFTLNTMMGWAAVPIGFGLVEAYASVLFEPLLTPGGALATTAGALIGTGSGRGIALLYVLFAVAVTLVVGVALRARLPELVADGPDAVPEAILDGLIGVPPPDRTPLTPTADGVRP